MRLKVSFTITFRLFFITLSNAFLNRLALMCVHMNFNIISLAFK
jgi:hypothetical protein